MKHSSKLPCPITFILVPLNLKDHVVSRTFSLSKFIASYRTPMI